MKKFNLLLLATLFAGSLAAQTTVLEWTCGTKAPNTDSVSIATGEYGNMTVGTAILSRQFGSSNKMGYDKGYYKLGGNDVAIEIQGTADFQEGDTVLIVGKSGGDGERGFEIGNSSSVKAGTQGNVLSTKANHTNETTFTAVVDATVAGTTLRVFRLAGKTVYVKSIKVVRPAPKTEPWLTLSATEVELAVTPFATSDEAKVTLKGGNLTDGTYTLTVPNVAGLTVEPASVTVADGTVNQEITLTYTSDVNVEAASAELTLTVGKLTASVTIDYAARVDAYTQTTVIDSTTWDWSKAGIEDVQLDSTKTTPTRLDTFVLANVEGIVNDASFNSQALLVRGQYIFYKKYNCFQGDYISFIAENKGTVQVTFSNTSKRNANEGLGRVLYINGVATNDSTLTMDKINSKPVEVPAGQVTITSQMPSQPGINQFLRVYSITFVPKETGTALEQNSLFVPATKVIRNGQLLIIREGKTYTVQGVEVK